MLGSVLAPRGLRGLIFLEVKGDFADIFFLIFLPCFPSLTLYLG